MQLSREDRPDRRVRTWCVMQPSSGPHPQPHSPPPPLLLLSVLLLALSVAVGHTCPAAVAAATAVDAEAETACVAAVGEECFITNSLAVRGSSKGASSSPKWCRTSARTA